MKILSRSLGSRLLFGAGLLSLSFCSCNTGPFPGFLEPLDPLSPVEGEATGWLLVEDDQSQFIVLSESGQFLHAIVGRNTSVWLEIGTFTIERSVMTTKSDYRYIFPKESGPIKDREGAQAEEVNVTREINASLTDGTLTLEGVGTFVRTADFLSGLDLEAKEGRGCMLRFVQMSIRIVQARIRNFGAAGTIIYQNNLSTFAGFLEGEQSIVVNGLLSPETVITYAHLRDIPEIELNGSFVTYVNTSGDGHLEDYLDFFVYDTSVPESLAAGGASGSSDSDFPIAVDAALQYGGEDPLQLTSGDVTGGTYHLEMREPFPLTEPYNWDFLEDLDLRGCYEIPEPPTEEN